MAIKNDATFSIAEPGKYQIESRAPEAPFVQFVPVGVNVRETIRQNLPGYLTLSAALSTGYHFGGFEASVMGLLTLIVIFQIILISK